MGPSLGGAAGAGGTGATGSTATVYNPAAQPQADLTYQGLLNQMATQGLGNTQALGSAPTGQYWPQVQGAAQQYFANPYAGTAQDAAGGAGGIGSDILSLASQALSGGNVYNPYQPQALDTAQTASGYGLGAAAQGYGASQAFAGLPGAVSGLAGQTAGYAPQVAGLAPQVAAGIAPLQAGANTLLQTGYDPQNALFNRTQQQVLDQSNATNSMYGLGSSPYGAGVTGQNLGNFDINWQNQQLARQAQALQGAGSAFGQAGGLGATAGGLYNTAGGLNTAAANQYALAPQIAASNLALGGAASNLAGTAGALPENTYQQSYLQDLARIQQAGSLAQPALGLAQDPYSTSIGQAGNAFTGLNALSNYASGTYGVGQQSIDDLLNYLNLGQGASRTSGLLGQGAFNQNQQQLGNFGSLAGLAGLGGQGSNLLYGSGGLSGALGLNPSTGLLGGLFGGGGADALVPGVGGAFSAGDLAPLLLGFG